MNTANSRGKILCSAIEIFAQKGKDRASMGEIAAKAGVSKSRLYRDYHTKNDLYREVLEVVLDRAFRQFEEAVVSLADDTCAVENFGHIATDSLDLSFRNPNIAKIVLSAVVNDTDEFMSAARNTTSRADGGKWEVFKSLVGSAAARVTAQSSVDVDPECLLSVLVGMNLTHLLGKPIAEIFLGMKVPDERVFLEAVERNVIDFWVHGILRGETTDVRPE